MSGFFLTPTPSNFINCTRGWRDILFLFLTDSEWECLMQRRKFQQITKQQWVYEPSEFFFSYTHLSCTFYATGINKESYLSHQLHLAAGAWCSDELPKPQFPWVASTSWHQRDLLKVFIKLAANFPTKEQKHHFN